MASSAEEVRKSLKTYLFVFGALAALTAVTVGVSTLGLKMDWPITVAVIIAMIVAITKGSLVGAYFMHLNHERGVIWQIIFVCIIFFLVLLLIPSLTLYEPPVVPRQ